MELYRPSPASLIESRKRQKQLKSRTQPLAEPSQPLPHPPPEQAHPIAPAPVLTHPASPNDTFLKINMIANKNTFFKYFILCQ
jgi:hypothetical protein